MSLSKKLLKHEIKSLYSTASSAIWQSHTTAFQLAIADPREEDFVATLVTDGIPILADFWIPILQSQGIELRISGVYCHGRPQVKFNPAVQAVELADLLIVHQHTTSKGSIARAILIQAKMAVGTTHTLPKNDPQLELYENWPEFKFTSRVFDPKLRNIKSKSKGKDRGSRYALILNSDEWPEDLIWADNCPWATCPAVQILSAEESLAELLGNMLLGKDGRTFQLGNTKDDWSKTIQELLQITGKRTYKRKNIARSATLRLTERHTPGMMCFAISQAFPVGQAGSLKRSVIERNFGDVPISIEDGGDQESSSGKTYEQPEGGISTLIIETIEGEQY